MKVTNWEQLEETEEKFQRIKPKTSKLISRPKELIKSGKKKHGLVRVNTKIRD